MLDVLAYKYRLISNFSLFLLYCTAKDNVFMLYFEMRMKMLPEYFFIAIKAGNQLGHNSWRPNIHPKMDIEKLLKNAKDNSYKLTFNVYVLTPSFIVYYSNIYAYI